MLPEEQILSFVETRIRSVWAVELLLVLMQGSGSGVPAAQRGLPPQEQPSDGPPSYRSDDLVREMRASPTALAEAIRNLEEVGFVEKAADGGCRFRAASDELRDIAVGIVELYNAKPRSVTKAIFTAPKDKLRQFADAFRITKA